MSTQRIVGAHDVDLCVETFGNSNDPTVLLIMGASASMEWWPDGFCRRLAAKDRHVIRYDHRDTGQSTAYEPGAPEYTGADLNRDAIGLLDVLGIQRAHLVGISMGGGIAQHLAFDYPERVASLTLISTMSVERTDSEASSSVSQPEEPDEVPEPSDTQPDWSDRKAVADYIFEDARQLQGTVRTEEADLRSLINRVIDRTKNIESTMTNHWILEEGDVGEVSLDHVTVPAVVIHGTEDPLFPYNFGEALAAAIPGARLVPLPGVGHGELPPQTWDVALSAIVDLTAH